MTDERTLFRAGGAAGLASMVLMLTSLTLSPPWPGADATTDQVRAYFVAHHDGFLWQAFVANLGATCLLGWIAAITALLRERGQEIASRVAGAAMTIFVASFFLTWIPWILIAVRPDRDAGAVQALYDFGLYGQFVAVAFPLTAMFAALAIGAHRAKLWHRAWIGACALSVPINVVLGLCTSTSGARMPNGPVGFTSIGLFTVVVAGTSVGMFRRGRAAATAV